MSEEDQYAKAQRANLVRLVQRGLIGAIGIAVGLHLGKALEGTTALLLALALAALNAVLAALAWHLVAHRR